MALLLLWCKVLNVFHSQLFKDTAICIKIHKIYNASFPPDQSIYKVSLYGNSSLVGEWGVVDQLSQIISSLL